jgi:tetratricopeptide (TPR) repeat protein
MKSRIVLLGCLSMFVVTLMGQDKTSVFMEKDTLVMNTEGVSFLGSGMSEDDAKTFAINDAKRNALEQAGTYLESHSSVLNHQLVKDEVITFSAGLLKVSVLKEERALINNMFALKINILSHIDINILNQRIKEIQNNSQFKEQLEAERERVKQLEARIAELQTTNNTTTNQEIKNVINDLSAIEWFNKGYATKDLKKRREYYSKAIEMNPQYEEAYINRGIVCHQLGIEDAAILDFGKAIELKPQDVTVYYNRGNIYNKLGNHDTAIRDYNKAIELDPKYASAYYNRGIAYKNLQQTKEAVDDFNMYLQINGNRDGDAEDVRRKIKAWGYIPK